MESAGGDRPIAGGAGAEAAGFAGRVAGWEPALPYWLCSASASARPAGPGAAAWTGWRSPCAPSSRSSWGSWESGGSRLCQRWRDGRIWWARSAAGAGVAAAAAVAAVANLLLEGMARRSRRTPSLSQTCGDWVGPSARLLILVRAPQSGLVHVARGVWEESESS